MPGVAAAWLVEAFFHQLCYIAPEGGVPTAMGKAPSITVVCVYTVELQQHSCAPCSTHSVNEALVFNLYQYCILYELETASYKLLCILMVGACLCNERTIIHCLSPWNFCCCRTLHLE